MMKTVAVFALAVGLVGPASAATTTLDFTADNVTSTGLYTVTGSGALSNATHGNNIGCTGSGWGTFACNTSDGKTDVGFGVVGVNSNEIDGMIEANEWVQVTFAYAVKIVAFAGMLTYNGSQKDEGTETVVLQYLTAGGWVNGPAAAALYNDNSPTNTGNDNFGTVGLAWLGGLSIDTTAVRFTAGGTGKFDDGNTNVTAAGLKVAPVPIPASFPLLLAGLGALGFAARRKQRKSA